MEHKEAEEFFKKQITSLDTIPTPVNWQKERSWYVLEEKLKPVSKKKLVSHKYYTIAASILLTISISWFVYNYINSQDKKIMHLQKKLADVQELKDKSKVPADPGTADHQEITHASLQNTSNEQEIVLAVPKKYLKAKNAPGKKTELSDFIPDSSIIAEPVLLSLEEDTQKIFVPVVKEQVRHTKSVQELMLSKVKKKTYSEKARQIIIVIPGGQEEFVARHPAEPSSKTEKKVKLSNIIINNNRESSTTETQQHTGADTYLRINPERIK